MCDCGRFHSKDAGEPFAVGTQKGATRAKGAVLPLVPAPPALKLDSDAQLRSSQPFEFEKRCVPHGSKQGCPAPVNKVKSCRRTFAAHTLEDVAVRCNSDRDIHVRLVLLTRNARLFGGLGRQAQAHPFWDVCL